MRVAIIGCGAIARTHADAIKKLGQNVVALCDDKIERAEKLRGEYSFDCALYDNYEKMMDEVQIDVVHVCSPHYLHAPMSIAALKRNVNVLSEKPVCISDEQFYELKTACESSSANFGVCFQNRYNAVQLALSEVVKKEKPVGIFASVSWKRDENYYLSTDWRGRKLREGGGVMMNQAIHTLDLVTLLLGKPVALTGSIANNHLKDTINEEDMAEMLIEFDSGATATFYATTANAFDAPVTIMLATEKGRYYQVGSRLFDADFNPIAYNETTGVKAKDYWGTGHLLLIRDFYGYVERKEKFPIGVEEAYRAVKLIGALYRSNGTRIEL